MYRRGLGTVAGSASDCAWCNEFNYFTYRDLLPSCQQYKGANCMTDYPSLVAGYVAGSAPAAPPDQGTINSQSANDTINQILAATQANAIASALVAANQEAAGNPAPSPPSIAGIPIWVWFAGGGLVLVLVMRR